MNKNILLVVVLVLIVGYIAGSLVSLQPDQAPSKQEIRHQLVEELREDGFLPPEPDSITEVTGTVTEVGEGQFIFEPEPTRGDPLNEFLSQLLTIEVSDQTEILQIKEKPADVLQQEEEEFEEKLAQYEEQGEEMPPDLEPPQPYTEKRIELSQLKQGDQITVIAKDNIKGKSEFEAETIQKRVEEESTE